MSPERLVLEGLGEQLALSVVSSSGLPSRYETRNMYQLDEVSLEATKQAGRILLASSIRTHFELTAIRWFGQFILRCQR